MFTNLFLARRPFLHVDCPDYSSRLYQFLTGYEASVQLLIHSSLSLLTCTMGKVSSPAPNFVIKIKDEGTNLLAE